MTKYIYQFLSVLNESCSEILELGLMEQTDYHKCVKRLMLQSALHTCECCARAIFIHSCNAIRAILDVCDCKQLQFTLNMAWSTCILSTWCYCNIIMSQLIMHCPKYPPRVDIESRSAGRIIVSGRTWNISAPEADLVVNSRSKRSTSEGM